MSDVSTDVEQLASASDSTVTTARRNLFIVSFLILFFELACIRWFGSTVIFLTFFTNLVLMACFLGMSVGLLTASRTRNYIDWLIPLTLLGVLLSIGTILSYENFRNINVDVGSQQSPQQIYFGTEYRSGDPSQVTIPLEVIAGVFFVLIAVTFVGLGQEMGRAFNAISNRITAYTIDIAGSLSGIVLFGIMSYMQTPPVVWFTVSMLLVLYLLWPRFKVLLARAETRLKPIIQIICLLSVLALIGLAGQSRNLKGSTYWSPYYRVDYRPKDKFIVTNNIGHQGMVSVNTEGASYSLPHLLNRDAGKPPFKDVLIIGAGSGNDVQAARIFGASSIDGVEIDPVIYALGRKHHPDKPYDDERVHIHLDDGRSFVKKSAKKYDLIIYALVDSLVLHSGYSSLRLESYLFTQEAINSVKERLKPGGVFAMYNLYRQGWVVARLDKMVENAFGQRPLVIALPYKKEIVGDRLETNAFTFVLAGDTTAIRRSLQEKEKFWINVQPKFNRGINGYSPAKPVVAGVAQDQWFKVAPAKVDVSAVSNLPTDDWPFLYLKDRVVPALNLRGMAVVAFLSLAVLFAFARPSIGRINWQMLFLGAGFMLLETKGVVHMALLFGSTWIVNSIVFGAILVMILCSNLFVMAVKPRNLLPYYALLVAALLVNAVVPMNIFLSLPDSVKVLASCAVFFIPVFFAGVIFATSFRDSEHPDIDFGSNVAGIILGGLAEYFSLLLGFNYLLLIAIAFYILSLVLKPRLPRALPGMG